MRGLHIKTIESGEILVWESGVYRCGGQRLIGAICQALADDMGLNISDNIAGVLGVIKRRTLCESIDFDKNPMRMSFCNGILDLKTMTLVDHSPDFLTESNFLGTSIHKLPVQTLSMLSRISLEKRIYRSSGRYLHISW